MTYTIKGFKDEILIDDVNIVNKLVDRGLIRLCGEYYVLSEFTSWEDLSLVLV